MRLKKLSYDDLSPDQKKVWDEVVAGPRKKMHGPFFIWLHSPELLSRGQNLGLYARFHSSLPPRLSELCILIMSAHWHCAGEWIDHEPIAREHGVDGAALEKLRRGLPAVFKQEDEQAMYDFAQELLRTHEVSDACYARARAALGERGVLDVVAVLGYYSMIAMAMKAFAMIPEPGVANPFDFDGR
ncbi:carboxymuconolactone decarboxylase family protein [Bradyrhizobium sp. LHD-71]|uniref:carboxymuconolactone decarboxylase family protein n=1 Tax=Bradyrhizobium sp. LHD-71 TaxID=3072141 RepID=UPI00280CA460|nr:carboxymuconolactone decarboxylase family protein [Bradyrhizobium sp. LHD-71]MDQ8729211.1 carboxymuconolactone decarboxylase family protein [Bradyrhizobium sp. LHD-71]